MNKFDLLKQAVTEAAPTAKEKVTLKFITDMVCNALTGEEVAAFGKTGKGLWGKNAEEHEYLIKKCSVAGKYLINEGNTKKFEMWSVDLKIVLSDYNAEKDGLIYTDKTFLAHIKNLLLPLDVMSYIKSVDYTEHGMQGKNFVSMEITLKIPMV